jgi:nucleotide-binding universal stress UspA family protein
LAPQQQQQQQEISKIVVPIDGSKNSMEAADYAVKMAEKYGSEVAVVHIVNLDQNLQLLGIYRLSYPDPVMKKPKRPGLRHKSGLLK